MSNCVVLNPQLWGMVSVDQGGACVWELGFYPWEVCRLVEEVKALT